MRRKKPTYVEPLSTWTLQCMFVWPFTVFFPPLTHCDDMWSATKPSSATVSKTKSVGSCTFSSIPTATPTDQLAKTYANWSKCQKWYFLWCWGGTTKQWLIVKENNENITLHSVSAHVPVDLNDLVAQFSTYRAVIMKRPTKGKSAFDWEQQCGQQHVDMKWLPFSGKALFVKVFIVFWIECFRVSEVLCFWSETCISICKKQNKMRIHTCTNWSWIF